MRIIPQSEILPPGLLLRAYSLGIFPMGRDRNDPTIEWVEPELRGVLPMDTFHVSKNVRARIRRGDYTVTYNQAFEEVMRSCAERESTWINDTIIASYTELHRLGYALSTEVWQQEQLVGGNYGVLLGRAFFGESMFKRAPEADKVALHYTWQKLRELGIELWDTQFWTEHLSQFGCVEIPQAEYLVLLEKALAGLLPATEKG